MEIEDIIAQVKRKLADADKDSFRLITLREAAGLCVKHLSSALHLRWWRRSVDDGLFPSVKIAGKHHVRSDHVRFLINTLKEQVG